MAELTLLHHLVKRVSSEDLYATLKFAVISLTILPVLPNQTYGPPPFDAFNPYKTWLDVDAITLYIAELAGAPGGVEVPVAARAVILAVMSNTIVKGVIALSTGSRPLRRALLPPFALILVAGGIATLVLV